MHIHPSSLSLLPPLILEPLLPLRFLPVNRIAKDVRPLFFRIEDPLLGGFDVDPVCGRVGETLLLELLALFVLGVPGEHVFDVPAEGDGVLD